MPSPSSTTQHNTNKAASKKRAEERVIDYHEYVDSHITRTGRAVKAVDIGYALLRLVVVVSAALLLAALVEHWLVTGGFSGGVRYLFFMLLAALAGGWFFREMWPLLTNRINPVYAARSIEDASPSLKNSLVNLLLFRSRGQQMPIGVYDALEQQAAERLVKANAEEVTDRTGLVRLGTVLVGILVIGAFYTLVSPKSPLRSAARLLMPWAEIAAPTRVQISDVQPGSDDAVVGRPLELTAQVTGLKPEEQPSLVLLASKPEDAQRLPMSTGDQRRFAVEWAPAQAAASSASGHDKYVRYRIEAGDARSPNYKLRLLTAPAIVVDRVEYDYPAYTGYNDREVTGVGDLRGIEGTKITLHAAANTTVDIAQIDFGGDGSPDISMRVADGGENRTATGGFTLSLRNDRRTPRHNSYVLRLTSSEGRTNSDPASYRIEVTADIPPEATLKAPEEPTRDVRLNEAVIVRLEARDPDFALSRVRILGEVLGERVFDSALLDGIGPQSWHEGPFEGRWRFVPAEHGLRPGDIVEYWVKAQDNRQPKPQTAATGRQRFRIVSPDNNQGRGDDAIAERDDPQAGGDQQNNQQSRNNNGDGEHAENQQEGGEQNSSQQGQPGQQNDKSSESQESGEGQQNSQQGGEQNGEQEDQQQGDEGQQQPGGLQTNQSSGQGEGENEQTGSQSGDAGEGGEDSQQPGGTKGGSSEADANGDQQSGEGEQGESSGTNQQSGESKSGNSSEGSANSKTDSSEPVSSDGDDDASAFERIREHLEQQENKGNNSNDSEQSADAAQNSEGQKQGQQGDKPAGDSQKSGSAADRNQNNSDPRQGKKPSDAQSQQGQSQQDQSQKGNSDTGESSRSQDDPQGESQNQGGDNADGNQQDLNQQGTNRGEQADNEGSPERDPSTGDTGDESEQSGGERSDSQSSESGQQKADERSTPSKPNEKPREGTGDLGQNQASDQGTGTAGDEGPGESTDRPGEQQQAGEDQQGKAGDQPGQGNSQRDGQGEQPGGNQGDDSQRQGKSPTEGEQQDGSPRNQKGQNGEGQKQGSGQQGDPQQDDPQKGDPQASQEGQSGSEQDGSQQGESGRSNQQQNQEQNQQTEQGKTRENPNDPTKSGGSKSGQQTGSGGGDGAHRGGEVGGDQANLDFARKQTDLVLKKLSDQLDKKQVDRDLLEKLGWTQQELEQFVSRWKASKQAAKKPGNRDAQQELDAALRSLGMRPNQLGQQAEVREDQLRDLSSGYRGKVPAKFRNRLRDYNRGVSRNVEQ